MFISLAKSVLNLIPVVFSGYSGTQYDCVMFGVELVILNVDANMSYECM